MLVKKWGHQLVKMSAWSRSMVITSVKEWAVMLVTELGLALVQEWAAMLATE
jgi:hypothetical protein